MISRVALVAVVVSEALAFFVLASLLAPAYDEGRPGLHVAALLVTALAAYSLPRAVAWLDLTRRAGLVVTFVVAYVVMVGALRLQYHGDFALWDVAWVGRYFTDLEASVAGKGHIVFGFVLLLGAWVRASLRSDDDLEMESVPRMVGIPFAVVTAVVLFSVYTPAAHNVAIAGAAYYAVAVLALACSQLARSGATYGDIRAGGTTAVLIGGTFGLTAAAVLVFWLLFGFLGPRLGPPLGDAVEAILYVLLYPPAWLTERFFRAIFGDSNPLAELSSRFSVREVAEQAGQERGSDDRSFLSVVGGILGSTVALAAVLLPPALVIYLVARFRRRKRRLVEAASSASGAGSFREDAAALLRAVFGRGGGRRGVEGSPIHRLYMDVLDRGARRGRARLESETPEEYAPVLQDAFHAPVTDEITAAFEEARYAGREPDARVVADMESRWRAAR